MTFLNLWNANFFSSKEYGFWYKRANKTAITSPI